MPYPRLEIDLAKIEHNTALIVRICREHGVRVMGVTKVCCGEHRVARAMLRGGVERIADSRVENLLKIRRAGIRVPLYLLRLPMKSQAAEVVEAADGSLNSELDVIRVLGAEASRRSRKHKVILMIDLGDLREGIWSDAAPDKVKGATPRAVKGPVDAALEAARVPGIELEGIGTNLTCFGGVCPTPENLGRLVQIAESLGERLGRPPETVSGGNSSSLLLAQAGRLPRGITELRIGEGIMLGRETVERRPIPGAHLDAFRLIAEVIEVKDKPSVPAGEIGEDAFGRNPAFPDRGIRRRAIAALGRQDAVLEGLTPEPSGIEVLGGSSDHLLLDVTDSPTPIRVGDRISFIPGYGALLAAMTSPYVEKVYVGG